MNRRDFTTLALLALPAARAAAAPAAPGKLRQQVDTELRTIERSSGGQLGVHIVDTASGAEFGHRADERFLLCSTFKLLASAFVLHRVDRGEESLDRRIVFGRAELIRNSPVTETRTGGSGMSLGELCEATMTTSDNTAANLILASYGGPPALTAFARALGDTVTRVDRIEPAMNGWRGIDDTTSPRAMLRTLQRLALGDALTPASRETLQRWMLATTTGDTRLKAGLPAGWRIGDRTGTAQGPRDGVSSNDIAIVWPPNRAPLLVTGYITRSRASFEVCNAALARVGALLPLIVAG